MYFKLSNGSAFLSMPLMFILTMLFFSSTAFTQELEQQKVVLQIKPEMCVALNQGRTCYAQVKIQWSSLFPDDFCIVKKEVNQAQQNNQPFQKIKCWEQSKGDSVNFEFESNESLTYQIITSDHKTLAETTLNVSWVHESSPRKRRWRLF